jgi:hypothetical protein
VDLEQVQGRPYNQTNFLVKVQITFQNPRDTSTWAAVIVQTPLQRGASGGYVFALNPNGQWQLKNIVNGRDQPVKQGMANINPQLVTMTVRVQDHVLSSYINNKQVISYSGDPVNFNASSSEIGLVVERIPAAPSSFVQFSNFELDLYS